MLEPKDLQILTVLNINVVSSLFGALLERMHFLCWSYATSWKGPTAFFVATYDYPVFTSLLVTFSNE